MNSRESDTAEPELFVVEGVLSDLHVGLGTENLLARIDAHYKGKAVLTGAGAVVGDLFGQAANAASLAMYDGEDTQNFMCLIGGQVMCGQFGGAEWLRSGHKVKAVVERRDQALYAHSIVDETSGLLWIGHPWGSRAEAWANWKIAGWCFGFGLFCTVLASAFMGTGSWSFGETIGAAVVSLATICGGVALWANHDMQALASTTTMIFRLLGFARPENVNLNGYRMALVADNDYLDTKGLREPSNMVDGTCQVRNVYLYQRAIADGRLALAA